MARVANPNRLAQAVLFLAALAVATGSLAESIYVNTNSDLPDTDVLDGVCQTTTGTCSLRAAIMHANWTWGHDHIYFNHGWEHTPGSPLEVESIITIHGEGSDENGTRINGNDQVEAIRVKSPPTQWNPSELTIEDVRIQDGRRNITVDPDAVLVVRRCEVMNGQASLGGGIYAEEADVTVDQSNIHGNTGVNGGGGVYFTASDPAKDLQITQSVIGSNYSNGNGAGVHAVSLGSTLTLGNTRLDNNQTISGNGGGVFAQLTGVLVSFSTLTGNLAQRGGGLYTLNSTATIRESSIWGNHAGQRGGGFYQTTLQGERTEIMNTTISGNTTAGSGGGIYLDTSDQYWYGMAVSSCTITGNTADTNTDNVGDGGGIYREGPHDLMILHNTILAGNNDLSPGGYVPDCSGVIQAGYNVVGVVTPLCELVGAMGNNQTGTVSSPLDPLLGPRTDEPYSAYHPLLQGSPAVNAADPAGCWEWWTGIPLAHDQLGESRPVGIAGDVGSIESPFIGTYTLSVSTSGTADGTVSSSPAGISCPGDCDEEYAPGTAVTLTPTPDSLYYDYFWGWTGDADCADGQVTMNAELSCTAVFEEHTTYLFQLFMEGSGTGTVVLDTDYHDFPCDGSCGVYLVEGEVITLLPTSDPGSVFVGFGGDPDCLDGSVILDAATQCTATFAPTGDVLFADDFELGNTSAWSTWVP